MDQFKIDTFKQTALQQGYDPAEVDSFVKTASMMPEKPQETVFSTPSMGESPSAQSSFSPDVSLSSSRQGSVLPGKFPVTQAFGNHSGIERYSGGVNLGADFKVPSGTPLAAPPGEWVVEKAAPGFNSGSGNFVKIRNVQTGESLGFEHLSAIGVQQGQRLQGGVVIGKSGGDQGGAGRGNSTGAHASIPYQDARGQYQDVLRSPYAKVLF